MSDVIIDYVVLKKMLANERVIGIDLGRVLERNSAKEEVQE